MMTRRGLIQWTLWLMLTIGAVAYLGVQLFLEEQKPDLLIGTSSHGHYQIELQCGACHTEAFGGPEVLQNACVDCHGEELNAALDSHPVKKFTDPRNANRIENLDARYCVSCHREHNPDITRAAGLTLPEDYCFECHQDIGEERDTHKGLGFETCASAGCHNFHDNLALYEDFLLKHAGDPIHTGGRQPARNLDAYLTSLGQDWAQSNPEPLPDGFDSADIHAGWADSAHGQAEVACSNCHLSQSDNQSTWTENPGHEVCATCHQAETSGFLAGKHGMRLARGLPPMTPAQARLPMKADAGHRELNCSSCHVPHADDTRRAAVEACLGCHNDDHSLAYRQSPHYEQWQKALAGEIPVEQGVSCATCHMPRIETETNGIERILVEHNQNSTLRPNEKMIRPTCMNCHGLGFAIDALADPALIENNFSGMPSEHIRSIDMAVERDKPTTF